MSLIFKETKPCSQQKAPIVAVVASNNCVLFLDFEGTLWMRRDD